MMFTNCRRLLLAGLFLISSSVVLAQETKQPGKTQTKASARTTETRAAEPRAPAPGTEVRKAAGHLDQFLVHCLRTDNQNEVAIAEIGREQASDREVKAFAEQMIQDHTDFLGKLQRFGGPRVARQTDTTIRPESTRTRPATPGTEPQKRQPTQPKQPNQDDQSSNDKNNDLFSVNVDDDDADRDQENPRSGDNPSDQKPSDQKPSDQKNANRTDKAAQPRTTTTQTPTQRELSRTEIAGGGINNVSAEEIMQLKEELSKQCLASAQRELSEKKGQEFDMCFVGMQIGGHMKMVDALTVFKKHASPELQQVLDEGLRTSQEHLNHAKKLAKKMEKEFASNIDRGAADDGDDSNK